MQTQTSFESCQGLVMKLKKNRESVEPELLKTKYAKAYHKLLEDIKEAVSEVLNQYFFSGLPLCQATNEELHSFLADSQIILDQEKEQVHKMSHVVFSEYDLTKAVSIVEPVRERIYNEAFRKKIWDAHCKKVNGVYHNDLIDMDWHPDNEIWMAKDGCSATIMLPPPVA